MNEHTRIIADAGVVACRLGDEGIFERKRDGYAMANPFASNAVQVQVRDQHGVTVQVPARITPLEIVFLMPAHHDGSQCSATIVGPTDNLSVRERQSIVERKRTMVAK